MAVQQNKKSPSRRNIRRSRDGIKLGTVATERVNGDRHLRHHISENGYYRGKQIIVPKDVAEAGDEDGE